jgi:hypothetical protein
MYNEVLWRYPAAVICEPGSFAVRVEKARRATPPTDAQIALHPIRFTHLGIVPPWISHELALPDASFVLSIVAASAVGILIPRAT